MKSMSKYYDFDGNEITVDVWARLFASPERFLRRDVLTNHNVEVSTVWIGLPWMHEDPALIYETMIFPLTGGSRWDDLDSWRWISREEALEGHQKIIDDITSGRVQYSVFEYLGDELL